MGGGGEKFGWGVCVFDEMEKKSKSMTDYVHNVRKTER